jgi:hypothetical protein
MTDQTLLQETHANRELFADVLLAEMDAVAIPLLRLDDGTRAAIVALVGAAQLVTAYERSMNAPGGRLGRHFDALLDTIHPEAADLIAGLRTSGVAESIAYTWMLALNRVEPSAETGAKATRAAAAEMACALNNLDTLMDAFRRLRLPAGPVPSDRPPQPVVVEFRARAGAGA